MRAPGDGYSGGEVSIVNDDALVCDETGSVGRAMEMVEKKRSDALANDIACSRKAKALMKHPVVQIRIELVGLGERIGHDES